MDGPQSQRPGVSTGRQAGDQAAQAQLNGSRFGPHGVGLVPRGLTQNGVLQLRTLDAVQGCGMGCSYCSIQTFYDDRKVGVDGQLAEKLAKIKLDPTRRYHIGSGQSSDSLLLGDRQGILSAQLAFARNNPNIVYEFKTKSKNVSALLRADVPKNLLFPWSMNTPAVIHAEEHGTASLDDRLATARKVADRGIKVGFHFHPIVRYDGYLEDYPKLIQRLMTKNSARKRLRSFLWEPSLGLSQQ